MTKTCNRCWLTKAIDEFHLQPLLLGGRRNQCKACTNAVRAKRRANPTKRRAELDRDNRLRRSNPEYRERHRLRENARRDADRAAFRAYRRDYYARKTHNAAL